MLLQQGHAAEGARADATLVLLHLGVGLQVSPQVGAVGEGPVAVGAGERALTWTGRGGSTGNVAYLSFLIKSSHIDVLSLSSQKLLISALDTRDNEEARDRPARSESV